ncbi:phage holin family protein [bacterium]|nr:phage holin family protein [bacterium]
MKATPYFEQKKDIPELLGGIGADVQKLVRQELDLAKLSLQEDWIKAKNAAALSVGAYTAYVFAGGLALVAMAFILREMGFALWGAFTLLALASAGVGVCTSLLARRWWESTRFIPKLEQKLTVKTPEEAAKAEAKVVDLPRGG